jgi:hypothetical protein
MQDVEGSEFCLDMSRVRERDGFAKPVLLRRAEASAVGSWFTGRALTWGKMSDSSQMTLGKS